MSEAKLEDTYHAWLHSSPDERVEAVDTLFREIYDHVTRLAAAFEQGVADPELVQESVVSIWAGLPKYRGEWKFSTWVFRIVHNNFISKIRRQRTEAELPEIGQNDATEARIQLSEMRQGASCDPEDDLLLWCKVRGMTDEEIAPQLEDCTVGAVRMRWLRLKERLLEVVCP